MLKSPFFWRWWLQQTDDIRSKVTQFVNEGRVPQISVRLIDCF